MRTAKQTTAAPAPLAPPPPRFEFQCLICDRTEFAATPDLPKGWEQLSVDRGPRAASCPECSAWLEQGE